MSFGEKWTREDYYCYYFWYILKLGVEMWKWVSDKQVKKYDVKLRRVNILPKKKQRFADAVALVIWTLIYVKLIVFTPQP